MRLRPWLNRGGTTPENPVLDGASFTVRLHKSGADETLRQCWVTVGDRVVSKLTGAATESEFDIAVPILAGTDLEAGNPAVENRVHFTTSEHRHVYATIYCATKPNAIITLDGYSGHDWSKPLIYPLFDPDAI